MYYCTLNVAATFVKFAMLPPMIKTFPGKYYNGKIILGKKKCFFALSKLSVCAQFSYHQYASLWSSETG